MARGKGKKKLITAGTNGAQRVVNWNLQDAVPISLSGLVFDTAAPVIIDFACGVNRWSYTIR